MWGGQLPADAAFYLLAGLAVYGSSWVVRLLVNRPWGQKPLVFLLASAVATSGVGAAVGDGFPSVLLTAYLWAWFVAFAGLLGPAHLLAAVLGTPGCEMRAYAHLVRRFKGEPPDQIACPGGIDRFDHIGTKTAATTRDTRAS